MIGMLVFVKVLIFNMFLQPYKFDNVNFPKSKVTLQANMYILGSMLYRMVKEVLREYLDVPRDGYYKLGNWLGVDEEFIVECSTPLMFNCEYPDEGEWISGLLGEELLGLEGRECENLKGRIREII